MNELQRNGLVILSSCALFTGIVFNLEMTTGWGIGAITIILSENITSMKKVKRKC